jgi:thiol-disulfide isomerase/thioredoxin
MVHLSRFVIGVTLSATLMFAGTGEKIRKAPDFTFQIPGKGAQTLTALQGKVVALEFIFTTCPHCQAASRYMTKLQAELGDKGLQVIDVAVNPNADLLVENFAKDYGVNFPVGWTTSDNMTTFMGFPAGRYVVPQLVLIDRKGYIHWQTPATSEDENWSKLMNQEAIHQHVEELLAAGTSTTAISKHGQTKLASAHPPQASSSSASR